MSKLAQLLEANQSGARHYGIAPLMGHLNIREESSSLRVHKIYERYRVYATFCAEYHSSVQNGPEYDICLSQTREMIINEVFGEFRDPILLLQEALNNQDIQKAKKLAFDIYNQMFKEGI